MSLAFAFNPSARLSARQVGHEASNVVIIDDVLSNAGAVVDDICERAIFAQPDTPYPGLNAAMPDAIVKAMIAALRPILRDGFGAPIKAPMSSNGFFSLVTLSPSDLQPIQTVPHIDNPQRFRIASVLYLCEAEQGGTGFFRQKGTGFERILPDRIDAYNAEAAAEIARRQAQPAGYFQDSDADYERIGHVDARFNRMIIYPSNLLHSGLVRPELLSADPRKGRLTANLFIGLG